MSDMLFMFTFGPVQSFIAEARRGQDLWAGSHILSELARAALDAVVGAGASSIYPETTARDIPNKFVVRLTGQNMATIAKLADEALLRRWQDIAAEGKRIATQWAGLEPDPTWVAIWDRQIGNFWECHWVAVPFGGSDYGQVYRRANALLDAAKRPRPFAQCQEDGLKDSLSGKRSALRLADMDAQDYWNHVGASGSVTGAQLKPDGKERLDAVGLIKRFSLDKASGTIASVSSIATNDFLSRAKVRKTALGDYKRAVEALLGKNLNRTRNDEDWPYDGDLFFTETLTEERLKDSYQVLPNAIDQSRLRSAQAALAALRKDSASAPSPYYAILTLDGDSMGAKIDSCKTDKEHLEFSGTVNQFAGNVAQLVEGSAGLGQLIYAGGDDVIALLPLSSALATARNLAGEFRRVTGNTASAGLAISHHLSPLGIALQESRASESCAKGLEGKNAIAIHVIKRSGEMLQVRSKWEDLNAFNKVVESIENGSLSSKIAYDVRTSARAFKDTDDAFTSEVRRLLLRHQMSSDSASVPKLDARALATSLSAWASKLKSPDALADWLLVARFMSGGEE